MRQFGRLLIYLINSSTGIRAGVRDLEYGSFLLLSFWLRHVILFLSFRHAIWFYFNMLFISWGKFSFFLFIKQYEYAHGKTVSTNISANSVSAGCDLTSLLPRYIVCDSLLLFVYVFFLTQTEYSTGRVHSSHSWSSYLREKLFSSLNRQSLADFTA